MEPSAESARFEPITVADVTQPVMYVATLYRTTHVCPWFRLLNQCTVRLQEGQRTTD